MDEVGQQSEAERHDGEHADRHVEARLREQREAGGDQDDRERGPQRVGGQPGAEAGAEPDAGDRAEQDRASQREVDVARDEVGDRGGPQQDRGVEDVGADDAPRLQPVEEDQRQPDEVLQDREIEDLESARALVQELRAWAKEEGIKTRDLLYPLRLALTERKKGPEMAYLFAVLGAREAGSRINRAREARLRA